MISGIVFFSSSQDYLVEKRVVILTDFARAELTPPVHKSIYSDHLYAINRRFIPVRWTRCSPCMQGVEGSTPYGGTCPNDFSDPIDQDIRTQ